MKNLILIITILFFPFICKAQFQVSGLLKDNNDIAVLGCAIKLKQADTVIKSTLSDENGNFIIDNVSKGQYTLEIVSVFYENYEQEAIVDNNLSLGTIILSESTNLLEEIIITGKIKPVQQTENGVVLNVANTRLSNQSDIISILNYAPNISTNNGLKIFGSDDILVLLDEKEIRVDKERIANFIASINPKTVESIEVIDRVDGSIESTKSGIIKITTIKKNGWSGSLKQGVLYNDEWGYNTNASLFYTQDKFRIFGDYDFSRHKTLTKGKGNQARENQNLYYDISENGSLNRKSDYATLGADYNFNKNNSLSFLYLFEDDRDDDHQRNVSSQISDFNTNLDSLIVSKTRFDQINKMHSFSLSFDRITDTLGSNLNIALDFAKKNYRSPFYQTNIYQNNLISIEEENQQNSKSNNDIYAFNTSWKKKFADKKELTLGSRISLVDNEDYFDFLNFENGQWITNTNFSNDFFLKEYIISAFSTFSFPVKEKSKISLGLRSEYNYNDYTNGIENGDNENFRLLPNIMFSTKLWGNSFYLSASQRLSRPNYSLFNPTYVQSQPTSAYSGNENLKPIDIYHLQTGYIFKNNLRLDVRYNYSENNILTIPTNINGILVTRPENIGYRNDVFAFISFPYKITDWWETYTKLTGAYLDFKLPNQKFSSLYADLSLNNTFYLPLDMELNIYYSYTSDYRILYTKNKQINSLNINLSYPVSESFTLNAGVSDVFKSLETRNEYNFNGIYNYNSNQYNSRTFSLSITYNFAKGKEVDEDIRKTGIEEEKSRL